MNLYPTVRDTPSDINERTRTRILARSKVDETGCWVWSMSTNQYGYGQMSFKGKNSLAHRVSYEAFIGPIPEGMQLDHLCRNRRCVNPLHLDAVTNRENVRRGEVGNKTHCPEGHPYDAENTYTFKTPHGLGRQCRICQRRRSLAWKHQNATR